MAKQNNPIEASTIGEKQKDEPVKSANTSNDVVQSKQNTNTIGNGTVIIEKKPIIIGGGSVEATPKNVPTITGGTGDVIASDPELKPVKKKTNGKGKR